MMDTYVFPLTMTIRQRDDGSYIATGKQIPVLLVAADRVKLAEKLTNLQASLDALLAGMSQDESRAYLLERGVVPERVGASPTEEYSMPVLISA